MRRFLFLALLSFAVSGFAAANTTNTLAGAETNSVTPGGPLIVGKKVGDRTLIPSIGSGTISCLANGHVAIDGVDQGSASVWAGATENSCTGGIHVIQNSKACQA